LGTKTIRQAFLEKKWEICETRVKKEENHKELHKQGCDVYVETQQFFVYAQGAIKHRGIKGCASFLSLSRFPPPFRFFNVYKLRECFA